MISKIQEYIDNAFSGIKETKKIRELKDELYANLIEKYDDEVKNGKSEIEGYKLAIASIGDIDELVESVKISSPLQQASEEERRKSALMVATAVGIYIISPMLSVLAATFNQVIIGLMLMFLSIAFATGLLIYNNMTKPKYVRADDTIVEAFKEWKGNENRRDTAYKSFHSAFWGIVVAIYLLISFTFDIWGYSWIIFIAASALQNIIKGVVSLRRGKDE